MNSPSKRKPRPTPEPGRQFVNREKELQIVRGKLETGVQGNPMSLVVTCFWGAFGMGKSWLLRKLETLCNRGGPENSGSHPTITARLDLNKEVLPAIWEDDEMNREQLIEELWKQLAGQTGTQAPTWERASADHMVEKLVKQVTAWAAHSFTPVIMLDTVDDLIRFDEDSFYWLEKNLVERLAITDRVLFVFASRGELRRWKRFQVRRRVDSHRLTAFDVENTRQEIKASPAIGELLYRHTFGHPLVTDYVGTALEERKLDLKTLDKGELHVEESLMQSILKDVIQEILHDVPQLAAQLARYASVLRWVSVEPLRHLAEHMALVEEGRGDAYYLDNLISELQAHHLLYWNINKNNYEFDPVLRKLLTYFLKLNEPDKFCEAHRTAFDFHRQHLERYPQYLDRYATELAYHRQKLTACSSLAPPPPTPKEWLAHYISHNPSINPDRWHELAEALAQDSELKDVLPKEEYDQLYTEAQTRASQPQDN